LGLFGPKGAEIGTYRTTFVYQGPFKKDSSTGSRVINEVVLEGEFSEVPHSLARCRRGCLMYKRATTLSSVHKKHNTRQCEHPSSGVPGSIGVGRSGLSLLTWKRNFANFSRRLLGHEKRVGVFSTPTRSGNRGYSVGYYGGGTRSQVPRVSPCARCAGTALAPTSICSKVPFPFW
jgi:hypothetical protein